MALEKKIANELNVKAVRSWTDGYDISPNLVDIVDTAVDWYAETKGYNFVEIYVINDDSAYDNGCAIAVFEDPKNNQFDFHEVIGEGWRNGVLCEYSAKNDGDITFRKTFFECYGLDPLTGSDSWDEVSE